MMRSLKCVIWPGFLTACLLEVLVFAAVDPADLHWAGEPLSWSRATISSLAFFIFWLVGMASSCLTLLLARLPDEFKRDAGEEAVTR